VAISYLRTGIMTYFDGGTKGLLPHTIILILVIAMAEIVLEVIALVFQAVDAMLLRSRLSCWSCGTKHSASIAPPQAGRRQTLHGMRCESARLVAELG
jgi:hypothetical protein